MAVMLVMLVISGIGAVLGVASVYNLHNLHNVCNLRIAGGLVLGQAVEGAFAAAAADEGLPAAEGGEAVVEVALGLAGDGHDLGEGGGAEFFDGAQGGVVTR